MHIFDSRQSQLESELSKGQSLKERTEIMADQTTFRSHGAQRVIVVSKDSQLVTLVQKTCAGQGLEVAAFSAVTEVAEEEFQIAHLVIIDVPSSNDESGVREICESSTSPVLALTESPTSARTAQLLRAGADLVMEKPFNGDDLLAHCDALHRRTMGVHAGHPFSRLYEYDDLVVDYTARTVRVSNQRVHLTSTQYRLIEYLSRHAGAICTQSQISEAVWGTDYEATASVIRSHIMSTRKALADSSQVQHYIKTENGVGYWMPRQDDV
jgi:two-component system, OmpR family, KDP operon response regulator KdpE